MKKATGSMLLSAATVLALVVGLISLPLVGCGSGSVAGGATRVAPDFAGVTLSGANVSLGEYRGRPLVLAFMASW